MTTQNYANHRQLVPLFHGVLLPVLMLTFIGSVVNLYQSVGDHQRLYSAALIAVLTAAMLMLALFCRVFALKAQDRAIRAEENLRYFSMTGKLLNPTLTVRQIVALRFASDAEFVNLVQRAVKEQLAPDDIKRAVQQWKPDLYRA